MIIKHIHKMGGTLSHPPNANMCSAYETHSEK